MVSPLPKFNVGDLVKDDKKIYEVLSCISKPEVNYFYRLRMIACLSDKNRDDAWNGNFSKTLEFDESDLHFFDFRKPKYSVGEDVKYDGHLCKIWFLFFENHNYYYVLKHIMDPYSDTYANYGWAIEESHLNK